jgi:hypothetical protein
MVMFATRSAIVQNVWVLKKIPLKQSDTPPSWFLVRIQTENGVIRTKYSYFVSDHSLFEFHVIS